MMLSTTAGATNNGLIRGNGATFSIANTQVNQGAAGVLNAINNGSMCAEQRQPDQWRHLQHGLRRTDRGHQRQHRARGRGQQHRHAEHQQQQLPGTERHAHQQRRAERCSSAGNATDLRAVGNQSILGTGTINLTNTTANRILGAAAGRQPDAGRRPDPARRRLDRRGHELQLHQQRHDAGQPRQRADLQQHGHRAQQRLGARRWRQCARDRGHRRSGRPASAPLSAINGGVVTINADAVISGGTLATADTGQVTTNSAATPPPWPT